MGFLDRLFNRKKEEEKKPETPKQPVVAEKPKERDTYTGMRSFHVGHKISSIGLYIDGVKLGASRRFRNDGKSDQTLSEDVRQTILVLQAEEAKRQGDTKKFEELKKRAIHEKSLLQEPEFKAVVLEAFEQATATGYRYTDHEYQEVFNNVMKKAETMEPNVDQRMSDAKEKLQQREGKESVQAEDQTSVQQTTLTPEQMRAQREDHYQK